MVALRWVLIASLCALAVTLCGCSGDSPSSPDEEALEIEVGPGTTPRFAWTPADLRFAYLLVERMGGYDMWSIQGDGNTIASGVDYGIVPPGITEFAEAETLRVGTEYRVILFTETATESFIAGYEDFTP